MLAVARTAIRTAPLALRRGQPFILRTLAPAITPLRVRTAASNVSNRPGSQSLGHAATNVKEEAGNAASSVAKTIAGANYTEDATSGADQSFTSVTAAIASQVPQPVLVLGLTGALPYLGTAVTSVYLARHAGVAAAGGISGVDPAVAMAVLNDCLNIQVTYGAVLLSFLGALHWGFEFAGYGGHKGYSRLFLGLSPVLVAWPTLAFSAPAALITQWVGFTSLWWFDQKATSAGWTPKWYSQYRFYLSILVGTCIIGTLAGTSFLGPVAGHSATTHHLELIRAERRKIHAENEGETSGDIESMSTGEAGDFYVKLGKRKSEESEEED